MTTRALVLGGGGVAGIAWEIGLLAGLAEAGLDASLADVVVGTSAGSVVGALVRSGADLERLYAEQVDASSARGERAVEFDVERMMAEFAQALAGATDPQDARARVGALARRASDVPEAERRAIIAGRLTSHEWPEARLLVTAVDTGTGELVVFDADRGVSLVDAVAASCAVPGVWPPVTVGAARYMDGGIRSVTNADLAAGHDRVLVLAPMPGLPHNPLGPGREDVLAAVRERGDVLVVDADEASTAAFGSNPLDPSTRAPSARAGRQQAAQVAPAVLELWGA